MRPALPGLLFSWLSLRLSFARRDALTQQSQLCALATSGHERCWLEISSPQWALGGKSPQSDVSRLLRLGLVFLALMREVSQADESPVCAGRLVSVFKLQYL